MKIRFINETNDTYEFTPLIVMANTHSHYYNTIYIGCAYWHQVFLVAFDFNKKQDKEEK